MQEFSEKNRWEAWMFSHGLQEVYNGVNALHTKEKEEDEKAKKYAYNFLAIWFVRRNLIAREYDESF